MSRLSATLIEETILLPEPKFKDVEVSCDEECGCGKECPCQELGGCWSECRCSCKDQPFRWPV